MGAHDAEIARRTLRSLSVEGRPAVRGPQRQVPRLEDDGPAVHGHAAAGRIRRSRPIKRRAASPDKAAERTRVAGAAREGGAA